MPASDSHSPNDTTALTPTDSTEAELRRHVRTLVADHETVTVGDIVTALTSHPDVTEATAKAVLDDLEEYGFVYLVPLNSHETEVKLP